MTFRWALLALWPWAAALHVAFVAPPASHYVPMLPIAHQLLDDGHQVTFLGIDETTTKISKVVPQAKMKTLEGNFSTSPQKKSEAMERFLKMPYGMMELLMGFVLPFHSHIRAGFMLMPARAALLEVKPDVVCVSYIYPAFYALGEALGIPVLGIGWASPIFLTVQNDFPWSLEPNFAAMYTRKDIYDDVAKLLENLLVRIFSFFALRLGSLLNSYFRYQIGHPRPLELWEYDIILQSPMVVMALPEFTSGSPSLLGPYTFMVGILDHPGMHGQSIAKSDDTDRVVNWLDERSAARQKVLYVAFGSQVLISEDMMRLLIGAFSGCNLHVLWATKRLPTIQVPNTVLVTKFAPQRAVLSHAAVFGFLSHGGANSVNEALMMGKPMVIMPFFGDQMAVAVQQQELGVALVVRKDADVATLSASLQRLSEDESFHQRATQVKELNDRRRDMSRAVEVIVNHGRQAFPMQIPAAPAIWLRLLPMAITFFLWSCCCTKCCFLHVRPQLPCCCRCRRGSRATSKSKSD